LTRAADIRGRDLRTGFRGPDASDIRVENLERSSRFNSWRPLIRRSIRYVVERRGA
jgi:hypothetical protein